MEQNSEIHQTIAIEDPENQPNFLMGTIAGGVAMLIGAGLWGLITYLTNYQIAYMAIGVGLLVGFAMKKMGRGNSILFGITAGLLSLVGCVLGNLLFYAGAISNEFGVSIMEVFVFMVTNPMDVVQLMVEAFEIMDLLFYAVATYAGFATAFENKPKVTPQPRIPA